MKYCEIEEQTETEVPELELTPVLSGTLFCKLVPYPVIVEMWDKRNQGRIGRAYRQQFTEKERNALARQYPLLYRWYFSTGTPQRIRIKPKTIALLQKAANFFGTI